MRGYLVSLLTIGLTSTANAHTLDGEHSMVQALWHQVTGGHHLPYTITVIGAVAVIVLVGRRTSRRQP